jgi:uncharacterized membrane protein
MRRNSTIRTVAAAVALAFVAGTVAYAQPKMEIVGGDTHDWGKVGPGKLTTVVQVKNIGDKELKITEVRPGCGCTAAPIDKNLLAPGEVGKISVTLDVTGRTGPVEKVITINSNDSTGPSRILHLKADIHRSVTCTPAQYMLVNDGKVGVETATSAVTIKNTGEKPFTLEVPTIADATTFSIRFDMQGSKELKPGEQFELKAFVTPKEGPGLYGIAKMKTTDPETPSLDITISGTVSQASTTPAAPATQQASGTTKSSRK